MRSYSVFFLVAALAPSCASRNPAGTAVKLPPPQPVFERQIQNAADAGNGDYEIRLLRQRMALEPDNLEIRLSLAQRYEMLGSPELALEHYRLAALRFPDSAQVHLLLARALRHAGARTEAESMLQVFLKTHPQPSPEFTSLLGILLDEQKRWVEGEQAHRQAVALAPKSDSMHNNLGYNLLMQSKYEAAAEQFREALKLNPRSEVARNNLAMALANKADQTAVNWQSVGDPAAAHNNLAALLIQQGRYAEARRELDLALGYNRGYSAALSNLRLVSELDGKPAVIPVQPAQGRWAKVKAGLRKAFVDDSEQPPARDMSTPENRRGL